MDAILAAVLLSTIHFARYYFDYTMKMKMKMTQVVDLLMWDALSLKKCFEIFRRVERANNLLFGEHMTILILHPLSLKAVLHSAMILIRRVFDVRDSGSPHSVVAAAWTEKEVNFCVIYILSPTQQLLHNIIALN
mmetsp:Transcript_9370/g.14093  ORF Transcript_9370/g.14093 Transcript_9370/m.14093 type:complete len:135 (-) Transcript_9370:426-830(-)